eukprot:m.1367891 g.1367891  ORF g.1367891 m.1367891 type:complete len:335 (+) comp24953_c0_seq28:1608-2612(+)
MIRLKHNRLCASVIRRRTHTLFAVHQPLSSKFIRHKMQSGLHPTPGPRSSRFAILSSWSVCHCPSGGCGMSGMWSATQVCTQKSWGGEQYLEEYVVVAREDNNQPISPRTLAGNLSRLCDQRRVVQLQVCPPQAPEVIERETHERHRLRSDVSVGHGLILSQARVGEVAELITKQRLVPGLSAAVQREHHGGSFTALIERASEQLHVKLLRSCLLHLPRWILLLHEKRRAVEQTAVVVVDGDKHFVLPADFSLGGLQRHSTGSLAARATQHDMVLGHLFCIVVRDDHALIVIDNNVCHPDLCKHGVWGIASGIDQHNGRKRYINAIPIRALPET